MDNATEGKKGMSFNSILKGAGITTLAGLVAFLATIFVTKDVFSKAMAKFQTSQSTQNIQIKTNELNGGFLKEQFGQILSNQKEILRRLSK